MTLGSPRNLSRKLRYIELKGWLAVDFAHWFSAVLRLYFFKSLISMQVD